MARRRRRKQIDKTPRKVVIDSIAHDGRGVGRAEDGQVFFVDYALPGETVICEPIEKTKNYQKATTLDVLEESKHRVQARCDVFGQCGGCVLQHLDASKQIEYKQQHLLENFKKLGQVEPAEVLPPLRGETWGYRRRARLGAKYVPKKGGMIVGFRERNSSFIQPTSKCEILQPQVSELLPDLRETLEQLSCHDKIPQVEITVAYNTIALIVRHLEELSSQDQELLSGFAKSHALYLYLQPGNLLSVHLLYPKKSEPLYFNFPKFGTRIEFLATDFIQVNDGINQQLVERAIEFLDIKPTDRVLDLFCGVGNFTLPIASQAGFVCGVEGDKALVKRANHNKKLNELDNVQFYLGDLFNESMTSDSHGDWLKADFNKVLLDPPRSGAFEMVKRMAEFRPEKIVYVSCGPATLARDAGVLVNELGYRMTHAGVIDMFPHTAHVESIAVFEC